MSQEEKRYTLEEAREELAKQECVDFGHDFSVLTAIGSLDPVSVICLRCSARWIVSRWGIQ